MSTDVSEVRAATITALMMEAARTSETSVDIQIRTWQYIPEHSELHFVENPCSRLLYNKNNGQNLKQWTSIVINITIYDPKSLNSIKLLWKRLCTHINVTLFFFQMALQPILEPCHPLYWAFFYHTILNAQKDSSGRVISSSQRPLPTKDNTRDQHLCICGIRTRHPSNQATSTVRPRGHRDRQMLSHKAQNPSTANDHQPTARYYKQRLLTWPLCFLSKKHSSKFCLISRTHARTHARAHAHTHTHTHTHRHFLSESILSDRKQSQDVVSAVSVVSFADRCKVCWLSGQNR
jgi:hypothetical protein